MRMSVTVKLFIAAMTATTLFCAAAAASDNPTASNAQAEILSQADASWDGVSYQAYPSGKPELTVMKVTIPPNTTLAWHRHPMPTAGYVLSGEVTIEKKDTGLSEVVSEGQVLPEMVGGLHRSISGDQGAELIMFYAGTKGMPLSLE